ncbi:PAS domain S-box protein [Erythrobacter colymbi]|uniref:hybrid sensor histidine kinase/response regulator n=1 Tax=Erythrobacter colymbi TaxID=1161202 RepID=UPI000A3A2CBC|nr:PAS domain S-box protein [Erythrobacter colymbi]
MLEPDFTLPPIPHDEPERLAALHRLNVLDTPPEDELDVITRLAADRFDTAIALVSLVDADRQWFKARYGLAADETCRRDSFCGHTICDDGVMVVTDAAEDPRFARNPLVTGEPNIRFYAGAPLVLADGYRVGTLCVIDPAPRESFSSREAEVLQLMARQVVALLEGRQARQERRIAQLIAETTTDAFVCADAMSRIILWNRAAEAMFGWSAAEALGQSLDLIIPHVHRQGHHAGVARLRAKGPVKLVGRTVEVPALCKAGHEFPVELSLAMWPDDTDGEAPAGFAAIIRDISARKLAEAEREATEARLARQVAAIEASDDGIALTDPQGVFIFMNRAHAAMFGYPDPSALIGRPWSVLYAPDEAQRINEEAMPVLFEQGQWRGETQGRRAEGTPIEQEIALSLAPQGGIMCITRDVSDRRAMEREKGRLREQLMLAQRQEVVGQLASGIAHDFNNLIAAISGTAELLRHIEDNRVRHHALRIQSAATTAAGLTEKLLTLGRRVPHPRLVDLRRTIWDVRDLVAPSLTDPLHRIELELPPAPLMALTDDTELNQVVLNLVLNARDALRPGGTARIKLEVLKADGYQPTGKLVLGTLPQVPAALIRVSDTGIGIRPEELEQVFEPFFTHKGEAGTGLGLAVVAGIIASNNGALAIQSWPDCGTVFEIWWPLEPGTAPDPAHDGEAIARPGPGLLGKAILVIDDNPAVVDTVTAMLEQVGAEVGPCLDPADAIAVLREDPAAWDLVITDYDMPRMNGAGLAKALRKLRADLPILLLTALPRVHQLHQGPDGVFDGVLGKPTSAARLAGAAAAAISAARQRKA